jgi:hypothetical protein
MSDDDGQRLRLRASDLAGMTRIAAALQDALLPLSDMRFEAQEQRFIAVANRFCWESETASAPYNRVLSGLRFDTVARAQMKGIDVGKADRVLSLLTIACDPPTQETAGQVVLHFAGGGAVRLTLTSLSCALEDVSEPWPTQWRPKHDPKA